MNVFHSDIRGVVWNWMDTLMREVPGRVGPTMGWPRMEAMPGASRALEALSIFPVRCIASNAGESDTVMIREALGRAGLRRHFTHVFTPSELGVSKPGPAYFRAVARRLGISPRRLLSVGSDLRKNIVPAKAAGMCTVLVSGSIPDSEEGTAADLIVLNLIQLERLFRSWVLSRKCG